MSLILKKEKYNTQLISLYLDNVIDLLKMPIEDQNKEWNLKLDISRYFIIFITVVLSVCDRPVK